MSDGNKKKHSRKVGLRVTTLADRLCRKVLGRSNEFVITSGSDYQPGELTKRTDSMRQLALADHVRYFDACQIRRSSEGLEPQHWPSAPLDETVVLFDDVIQVFPAHHLYWYRAIEALQHLLIASRPAVSAPLLSITRFLGKLLVSNIRAKDFVAASLFRRWESMKSSVLP